jgi:hypothetical protein
VLAKLAAGAAKGKRIEVWFQDEARVGQKTMITQHHPTLGAARHPPLGAEG